jgi:hypothetical protein
MDGGRFEMGDIPGMVPSPEEIRRQATVLAQEMYPEKFGLPPRESCRLIVDQGVCMVDPNEKDEEFARRVSDSLRVAMAPNGPLIWTQGVEDTFNKIAEEQKASVAEPVGPSPLTRLFTAVRAVIKTYNVSVVNEDAIHHDEMRELEDAFQALKLD